MKEKVDEIVKWLNMQLKESGQKGFVLGLSGGIDSALVAQLLMLANPKNSLGVILPAGNLNVDRRHGMESAKACKMPCIEVDLTDYRENLFSDINTALSRFTTLNTETRAKNTVMGNLGARLRMAALYDIGNTLNYLVVGTDNMAEAYTGYFTKYGDGGVDILPLAHLTKSEVFEMGAYLGVPQYIINKPPSAGFFTSQTDEDEMGVDYNTIDNYLNGEIISDEKREIIEKLHLTSDHKRKLPPTVR
ncbi:MAG: NAD(+) synthase [Clostridiales bacterium]